MAEYSITDIMLMLHSRGREIVNIDVTYNRATDGGEDGITEDIAFMGGGEPRPR